MRILLTGHKGFLGSGFVERYGKQYDIVGYDIVEGDDLRDYKKLADKMKGCEVVVHLAAIPAPVEGKSFEDYYHTNVEATLNIARASVSSGAKRIIYASSTTIYGVEKGIPFKTPIKEDQLFVSQYLKADGLSCRDVDLSYHMSKVMAEQIMAWYGLNKKIQTIALRSEKEFWYELFSIVDEVSHIDISKAKTMLGYNPVKPNYSGDQLHSTIEDRTKK